MQVGHVERFNPAYLAVKQMQLQPMFIEVHRLAQFNPWYRSECYTRPDDP